MHPNCSVTGACSTPDQLGLLKHPILERGLPAGNIQGQELASLPLSVPRAAPQLHFLKN